MKLTRFALFGDRTLGQLEYEDKQYWTIERPWLDNKPFVSCIPQGSYNMQKVDSPKFGPDMWQIMDVPNRTHILIHIGNSASNFHGCIGLGMGLYGNLAGVANSRAAINEFYELTHHLDSAEIEIVTGYINEL